MQVVMTPCAKDFITPVTLSALSGRPVLSEFSNMTDGVWNSHVELGMWADVMLVAPATASTLAKMAAGSRTICSLRVISRARPRWW